MKKNQSRSLQKTILLITAVFTIVIGLFLTAICTYFYSYYTKRSLILNTNAKLAGMTDTINRNIANVKRLGAFCQTHPSIGNYMNYKDGSSPQVAIKAYNRLNEEYLLSPASAYIHRVIIGTPVYLDWNARGTPDGHIRIFRFRIRITSAR